MKPTSFRSIVPLIMCLLVPPVICLLVLVLTTSVLALSRYNHHKDPTNPESFTNYATTTEIGLANSSAANFASNLQCAFHEDTSSLISSRTVFHQPTRYATTRTPNFSTPIRRAPIRRKGRIQH
jgi:hypothetical protein